MGAAYNVRDDRRGSEHDMYEPPVGHQDEIHGAFHSNHSGDILRLSSPPIQTQTWDEPRYLHTIDAARTIYRSEGIRAFYRGLLPSLLGIAHVAVQFPLYEQLKIWARKSIPQDFHEHAILTHLYVISRGSFGGSASTAGNSPLLCDRKDDRLDSDIPARSRSNAVADAETTAGRRHVIGRDGEAAFSTRSGLHCEEDRD